MKNINWLAVLAWSVSSIFCVIFLVGNHFFWTIFSYNTSFNLFYYYNNN